jgi:4-alpha-glucanotransferase
MWIFHKKIKKFTRNFQTMKYYPYFRQQFGGLLQYEMFVSWFFFQLWRSCKEDGGKKVTTVQDHPITISEATSRTDETFTFSINSQL